MLKKIIITIIILGAIGAVVYVVRGNDKGTEYVTAQVTRGTLTQSVEATGKVESAERIDLNFRTTGRISEMSVNVGDTVRANAILARLDSRALTSKVADARARVDKEKADYQKLLAGASDADIKVAEDTAEQKLQDLKAAQNTRDSLMPKRDTELANLKETAITVINNEVLVADGALVEAENTIDDPGATAENIYRGNNQPLFDTAKASTQDVQTMVDAVRATANSLSLDAPDASVLAALDDAQAMMTQVKTALENTMDLLRASFTRRSFSESDLDALKSNIQAEKSTANTSSVNIQTSKTNWTNKIAFYEDALSTADDDISQAQTTYQVAQSQLELKKSPARQHELDAQQAAIAQAEASLNLALANLEDGVIRAPLNGTITKKHFEIGEQTSLSSPVLEMIGDATLEIEVDIPESDIAKVLSGQQSEITLDAFGEEVLYQGNVTFVDPAETIIQDVVYYKVTTAFSDSGQVKPGMTANVTIITDIKHNVLFVPFRAVKSRNGEKYVEILDDTGMASETIVLTGIRGDEGIEITAGLVGGEQAVTFVKE